MLSFPIWRMVIPTLSNAHRGLMKVQSKSMKKAEILRQVFGV